MDQSLFIALLNPAVSLILACAFLIVWVRLRRTYVLLIAVCYVAIGCAFLFQGFGFGLGLPTARFVSNICFFAGILLAAIAVLQRRGIAIPGMAFAVSTAAGVIGLAWFMFFEPHFEARVHVVSYSIAAICLIVALRLHRAGRGDFLDETMKWLACLRGITLIGKPFLVSALGSLLELAGTSAESSYWLWTSLTSLIFSLLFALVLFARVASDVIAEISVESRTDALSGLLNRRGFEEGCEAALSGGKLPVCLVLADLDRFKSINDTHGHDSGDAVIRSFGRLIARYARRNAIAGRIGGEEFAILLPGSTPVAARLLAESLRSALAAGPLEGVPASVGTVTCSFGIGTASGPARLDPLYREADKALLRAKQRGRNCVDTSWGPGSDRPAVLRA